MTSASDNSDDEMDTLLSHPSHYHRNDYVSDSEVFPTRDAMINIRSDHYRSRTRSPPSHHTLHHDSHFRARRDRFNSQPSAHRTSLHPNQSHHKPAMSRAMGPSYARFLKNKRVKSYHVKRQDEAVSQLTLPKTLQRVYGTCFAQALDLEDLKEQLLSVFHSSRIAVMENEVIFVSLDSWSTESACFVFCNYGVALFWNVAPEAEKAFLTFLRDGAEDDVLLDEDDEAEDDFEWFIDESEQVIDFAIVDNILVIPKSAPSVLVRTQLAISYGMATSIKLETLEIGIEKTIESTRQIPQDMSIHGKMGLSKMEISKYIGTLYIQKASVNLMYDILDSPDYVWDDQLAEKVYLKCRNFLKIETRVTVLNKRLDVLAELLEMLRTEKSEQHSTRLEWIVIILIVVEVILGVVDIVYTILAGGAPSVF